MDLRVPGIQMLLSPYLALLSVFQHTCLLCVCEVLGIGVRLTPQAKGSTGNPATQSLQLQGTRETLCNDG